MRPPSVRTVRKKYPGIGENLYSPRKLGYSYIVNDVTQEVKDLVVKILMVAMKMEEGLSRAKGKQILGQLFTEYHGDMFDIKMDANSLFGIR